jgi:LmbE family N-acetylglucosaminyl deacetylase
VYAAPGPTNGRVQVMHVVAHPDDDLFFMNPDVYQTIRAGVPTVTVYITASEISGAGNTPEQKAKSLQRGVQDAYARMAGVADVDPNAQEEWTGAPWTIGTRKVERFSLVSRPEVQLVFMNLHDANLGNVYDWGATDTTVIPTGSTVASYSYNKSNVTSVLLSMLNSYQPTVLRYQDPLPDGRYTPDHVDHYAGARFVTDATAQYTGPVVRVPFRDYNIANAPRNLNTQETADKTNFFNVFFRYDPFATPSNWLERQYHRWPGSSQWAGKRADGRPQAFVLRNGVLNTVWQNADGTWAGPTAIPNTGGPLVGGLSVVSTGGGRLQVFARRQNDHHIVTIRQNANGNWPASWTSLGNPNIQFGGDPAQVGTPTAVQEADGSLWLFVKDGGGGLCGLRQASVGGSWGSWLDMGGGSSVQDGLAAILGNDGRVELFASTMTNVLKWRQSAPNGNMVESGALPTGGNVPASPPAVTKNQDGTLEVIYRAAGSGNNMVTTFQTGVGGGWNPSVVQFGGHGGRGQAALVTAPPGSDARIMVFASSQTLGISTTKQSAPDSAYESWVDVGGPFVDNPSATSDSSGAVYLFAVGLDGRVHFKKQTSAGANSPYTNWQAIG